MRRLPSIPAKLDAVEGPFCDSTSGYDYRYLLARVSMARYDLPRRDDPPPRMITPGGITE
jgi:hypothetical protein